MKKLEELLALSFAVAFPAVVGFVVAVWVYVDGLHATSLILIGAWLAATGYLWSLPYLLRQWSGKGEVVTDERNALIRANAALIAHAAAWCCVVFAVAFACWNTGVDGVAPVNRAPLALIGALVVFQVVYVLSGYVQEKRRLWPVKN